MKIIKESMARCIFSASQHLLDCWVDLERVTPPDVMLTILQMARNGSDAYLSAEQQTQLDIMIEQVQRDIKEEIK